MGHGGLGVCTGQWWAWAWLSHGGMTVFGAAEDHRPYKPGHVLDLLEESENFKKSAFLTKSLIVG